MDENKTQSSEKDLKVLRTYTSDMADAIRTNEMSVIKIALAEKDRREQEDLYKQAEGTNTSKIFLVIGGIILIAGAIWGSTFLIQKKKEMDIPKVTMDNIETFISYDSKLLIDTTLMKNVDDLFTAIKKETQDTGLVEAIFLTKTNTALLTTNNFLSLINSTAPAALTRSLSDKYLFGRYSNPNADNINDKTATFLILYTNDYPLSYASMLEWEKTMLKDLYVLFNIKVPQINNSLFEKPWGDTVINNKDVRVIYGDDGRGILYYVFVNKNDLVITTSVEAMKEVISRLITKDAKPL